MKKIAKLLANGFMIIIALFTLLRIVISLYPAELLLFGRVLSPLAGTAVFTVGLIAIIILIWIILVLWAMFGLRTKF
ncbi:MAG: hypothetical protein WCT49_05540 [Candidatus Paceibacterota bacterium]|jgi:hypothetical protein|nr:hypothetical protein [Candidatus Paceibacterota bacterium]